MLRQRVYLSIKFSLPFSAHNLLFNHRKRLSTYLTKGAIFAVTTKCTSRSSPFKIRQDLYHQVGDQYVNQQYLVFIKNPRTPFAAIKVTRSNKSQTAGAFDEFLLPVATTNRISRLSSSSNIFFNRSRSNSPFHLRACHPYQSQSS